MDNTPKANEVNEANQREVGWTVSKLLMYEYVYQQLECDGLHDVALYLSEKVPVQRSQTKRERLYEICSNWIKASEEDNNVESQKSDTLESLTKTKNQIWAPLVSSQMDGASSTKMVNQQPGLNGLDKMDLNVQSVCNIPLSSKVRFSLNQKMSVLTTKIDANDTSIAYGGTNCCVKLYNVPSPSSEGSAKPNTIQQPTLLNTHDKPVTCIEFHPTKSLIFSGSLDCKIKGIEFKEKQASDGIIFSDVYPIKCMKIHPSGDFLYAGSDHNFLRLYDLTSMKCYTGLDKRNQHQEAITLIECSADARIIVTGSSDGSIKFWDGVTNKVCNVLKDSHGGYGITSAAFDSRTLKLLTTGLDGHIKLWDMRTGRQLLVFGNPEEMITLAKAQFILDESLIAYTRIAGHGSNDNSIFLYTTSTGSLAQTMKLNKSPISDFSVGSKRDSVLVSFINGQVDWVDLFSPENTIASINQ